MKTKRITLDFSAAPKLLELVRAHSLATGKSQKEVFSEALTLYFALSQENLFIIDVAEKAFAEWDNEVDAVYDTL